MQEAFSKNKGALHRDLGVPENEKIPSSKLRAAVAGAYGKKTKQRAVVAQTARRYS